MKKLRLLFRILKQTGAGRILLIFVIYYLICAVVIWLCEPQVLTLGDALWYCYAVITTIGFGDVIVTTRLARGVSIVLSIYSVIVLAIATGVVVNYYNQLVQIRQSETIASVLDKLEELPEMSREQLEDLSERIKKLRK